MYIEINGEKYHLSIRDSGDDIRIIEQKDDVTYLAVPARIPHDNLISYLKEVSFTITNSGLSGKAEVAGTVRLFDTDFTLFIQPVLKSTFIKGKAVFAKKKPTTEAAWDRLAEDLLMVEIKVNIGFWEEILDVFINTINLRKLKTNFFTFCKDDRGITFNKSLIHRSREFISYVCAVAIFDCLDIEEDEATELKNKYIKDWRHYQKVLSYEISV